MPVIESKFRAPWYLQNGHVQTILPVILRRNLRMCFRPERLELADGDFLDLAWAESDGEQLAILSHGLEGCFENDYIAGMTLALQGAGWDVLAWNFRGCGRESNRLARFYHSGETGDLGAV